MNVAELTIESIAAGGDGIGRAEGVAVFVPRTAPGDRVRVRLDVRRRFARGIVDELIEPSPDRVDPLCYHYRVDRCGGCQIQHLRYEAQLDAKRTIIRDALTRIGHRAIDAPAIVASERQWRYRHKLTLTMRRRPNGNWVIGLRPYDDPAALFQLADCPITDARVLDVWRQVMEARPHFPPADELRASVRLLDAGASVVMEGGNTWPARAAFFTAVPLATSLWWKPVHRARALVAERGGASGGVSASASFAQVNVETGAALHDYVLARAKSHRPGFVVDAYAGSGATAVPLARDGARVTAIEADRDAAVACASQLPSGSRAISARVEDALDELLPADVVLVNPPRTGLHERVSDLLQKHPSPPRALVYVSCDPATLGRDLARMPRYRIASLRAFDMFPQTAHVETVCELMPEDA